MDLPFVMVDVFSRRPLQGNQLCVFGRAVPTNLMRAIALEIGHSETCFISERHERCYRLTIMTPTGELPFAGHPSLGAAWTLGAGRWTQSTVGATVNIDVSDSAATMTLPPPVLTALEARDLASAIGCTVHEAALARCSGNTHLLLQCDTDMRAFDFDEHAIADVLRTSGAGRVCLFAVEDRAHLSVRTLYRNGRRIAEDPGTGSVAGPVVYFAMRVAGCDRRAMIRQGEAVGRACEIEVDCTSDDGIRVTGAVVKIGTGTISL